MRFPASPQVRQDEGARFELAALRPQEAVNLRRGDVHLPALIQNPATGTWEEPADNWGELRFCSGATEVGAECTDDGNRRDHRQLKARARGEWH